MHRFVLGLFLTAVAACAGAQGVFLQPSSFRASGERVSAGLVSLDGVRALPTEGTFSICGSGFRQNLGSGEPVSYERRESALVGVSFPVLELESARLTELTKAFDLALNTRRVRVISSAICAIVGTEGSNAASTNRLGLATELRLMISSDHAAGADVALRFYGHEHKPARGAPVRAIYVPTGERMVLSTDQAGMVNLAGVREGVYRVAAVQVVGDSVYIATNTFEVTK